RDDLTGDVPALPSRLEARLAILCVVLRAGLRGPDEPHVLGSPLHPSLRQSELPRGADAVHALLPMVPFEGQARMAAARQPDTVPFVPLGRRYGFLASLSLVHESAGPMSTTNDRVQLFLGASDHVQVDREFPQGVVALRSLRSPEKETPNEDAAAIIWLSDNALVLAVADGVGGTPAGREASNVTVTTLSEVLTRRADPDASLRPAILDAIEEANRSVIELARGAATTLVVA